MHLTYSPVSGCTPLVIHLVFMDNSTTVASADIHADRCHDQERPLAAAVAF